MTKPSVNPHIFRAYDIRGFAQKANGQEPDLTPETVNIIGKGIGTYMIRTYQTKNMMVGRDNRLHSEDLQKAFIKGILSTGIDVTNIGIATSPLLYYGVCKFGMDSGVNITASHNPKEYNGIKVVQKGAHAVCGDELQQVLHIIEQEDFIVAETPGTETNSNKVFLAYKEDLIQKIPLARPLKIVIDAGNATAGKFAPELFRALGCEVVELYCELDGNYPNHEANPEVEANMRDLGEKVRETKAHIGIAFDGDGDRVGAVDEHGKHYNADYLIILLARDLLKNRPSSDIVFDVKVSRVLIDEISNHGGNPVMCKVGHSFIDGKMREIGAPLAGELSGHVFFGQEYYKYYGFDDAFFGAAKLLQILSQDSKTFSEHFQNLPKIYNTPEYKAPCPDNKKFTIVKELTEHFTQQYDCVTLDGVRINFTPTSWGAVRCSNTSPNLTMRFEAETPEELERMKNIMFEQLKKYPEVNLDKIH